MASRQVDDAQPAHPEPKAVFGPGAFIVRTTMDERLRHPVNDLKASALVEGAHYAGNSAHVAVSYRIKAAEGLAGLGKCEFSTA
jgi:hypothetical protein